MNSKKIRLFFILACICLFSYEAGQCLYRYLEFDNVSKQTQERQENHPMPEICISSTSFAKKKLTSVGLEFNSYVYEGQWVSNSSQLNEEEMFEFASPKLSDLVDKVSISKTIDEHRDAYQMISFNTSHSKDKLEKDGLIIKQVFYYYEFAIFCFSISSDVFPFGIQKIWFLAKENKMLFTLISAGNYYVFERKRNEMVVLPGFTYDYQIYHDAIISLTMRNDPCKAEMRITSEN